MYRLVPFCLLLILSAGCDNDASRAEDPKIRRLVDDVVTAYGGEQALSGVSGYLAEGRLFAPGRNLMIRTRRWFGRPDRLLLELDYPGSPEWRLTRGAKSWKGSGPQSLAPAIGPMIWSMRLQTARLDLPLRLREVERELQLQTPDAQGRTVLHHDFAAGLGVDYHIDPATYRIVRMTLNMVGPPATTFAADYSGFREVDGVLFPHREVTWAGGTITSKVVIESFLLNPQDGEESPGVLLRDPEGPI